MIMNKEFKKLEKVYKISDRLSYIMGRLEPLPSLEERKRLYKEVRILKKKLKEVV